MTESNTATAEVIVTIELAPITFIDRDNAKWTVDAGEYEGQPILRLMVTEDGEPAEQVVFHKDDAAFISWLIEQAAK